MAQVTVAEVNTIKRKLTPLSELCQQNEDIEILLELAKEESDQELNKEAVSEYAQLIKHLEKFELLTLLAVSYTHLTLPTILLV